MVAKTHQFD